MKPTSKPFLIPVLGLLLLAGAGAQVSATERAGLFSLVPQGDPAYTRLKALESDGLLAPGDSKGPLTRFEMAERIFKAETKFKEVVVAQADMDLPPPPPDAGAPLPPGDNAANTANTGNASDSLSPAESLPLWKDPKKVEEAEKNLQNLQEAYDFELKLVRDQKDDLDAKLSKAEADQFDLWRSVRGITEYPSVSIHGVGRAMGIGQQYFGTYTNSFFDNTGNRQAFGYLDLEPTGSVSKELRWKGIIRLGSSFLPKTSSPSLFNALGASESPEIGSSSTFYNDFLQLRWVEAKFNPEYMSVSLGDFYEAYSPFTLWGRDSEDLFYKPEPMARWESIAKYETFMDRQPELPFRGLRIGTALGWPDSKVLESASASGFVHMIRQGFNDGGGGWYMGSNIFTDLILAGKGTIKSKKWYAGGMSWQVSADAYGIILDEPLDSTQPGSPYGQFNTATWAHQYMIGSVAPTLRVGVGDDVYLGAQYEGAFASFQDDKRNTDSTISDYAMSFGPFFQFGDSKVSLTYLNVGPNYYSPLAQTRDVAPGNTLLVGPESLNFQPMSQFFLSSVPRAGAIFGYYDRTLDNVFPYGLATPNREGFGGEIDIKTLEKKSLRIRAAAYFLDEISGNFVVNSGGTGYTGLDTTAGGEVPKRNFVYFNLGPSIDIGPGAGLSTPFVIGTNVRFEETSSVAGTLDSLWVLGGVEAGLFPGWQVGGSFGTRSFSGSEMGIGGVPTARATYLFDNTDLGQYSVFTVNGYDNQLILSTTLETGRNTKVHFDYSFDWTNELPYDGPISGTLNNEFMELTYETEF
ncbi:MAG TPA: hypothetical protein VHE12_00780 [bacterium]|nr:hypothetical protein [bacterium]